MSGITFDAGGLIALDRNDRRVLTLVARATELGLHILSRSPIHEYRLQVWAIFAMKPLLHAVPCF